MDNPEDRAAYENGLVEMDVKLKPLEDALAASVMTEEATARIGAPATDTPRTDADAFDLKTGARSPSGNVISSELGRTLERENEGLRKERDDAVAWRKGEFDSGDDGLYNVRRLRAEVARLKAPRDAMASEVFDLRETRDSLRADVARLKADGDRKAYHLFASCGCSECERIEAAIKDGDRLDWLEANNVRISKTSDCPPWDLCISASGEFIRSAIDAARKEGK